MKKILFFSSYFYPYTSGITTYPFKILSYLSKNYSIKILTFPHKKLPKKEVINNLKIIRMPYFFKISKGYISPQSILYFAKEAKRADIIILNQPNFEGVMLALIAKLYNKKIISIFHCQVFLKGSFFEKIANFFLNLSMFIQLCLSQKIVFYTKDYALSVPFGKIFQKKGLFVLPPIKKLPVEKNFLKKLESLKDNSRFTIGFAGRISREKGIEYLIEAAKILQSKNIRLQIFFAGPFGKEVAGESNYYIKIKSFLEKEKILCKFLGNLKEEQLGAFYKASDVIVLPSVNSTEAFGMVQAEAMLLKTPVISTNLPGVRVPIKLTKMGIVVKPKDSKQLADAIKEIIFNKEKYVNDALYKNAQKSFDINKTYKFYENLLKTL